MRQRVASAVIMALCACRAALPAPVNPVAFGPKSVGDSLLNAYTPGVSGGLGPHNLGLFVRVWGKVTQRDTTGMQYL